MIRCQKFFYYQEEIRNIQFENQKVEITKTNQRNYLDKKVDQIKHSHQLFTKSNNIMQCAALSHTSNSPRSESSASSNLECQKKLMNRKELEQVIINKFIKDNPEINEQLIEKTVQSYLKQLNCKLSQLNLKELKQVIQDLAKESSNLKKTSIGFNLKKINSASQLNDMSSQEDQNSVKGEQNMNDFKSLNKYSQVKKVNYPSLIQNQRIGQSLSPRGSSLTSTTSSYCQQNIVLEKPSQNQFMQKQERSKSPLLPLESNLGKGNPNSKDLKSQNVISSIGIKSILKKANRSLSPLQERQISKQQSNLTNKNEDKNLTSNSQDQNQKQVSSYETDRNPNKKVFSYPNQKREEGGSMDEQKCNSSYNLTNQQVDNSINSSRRQGQNNDTKSSYVNQKQLDDKIKYLQKNNYNIIHGQGLNQINSYWQHLEDIQQNSNKHDYTQENMKEWRNKFDLIKNLRLENQIQEELKKESKAKMSLYNKYNNEDDYDDDESGSQITTNETVNGYELKREKGALCEILSQQQYIDINYAEYVKRSNLILSKEEELQKRKKLDSQRMLKDFYDCQVSIKQNNKEKETETDKQYIVMHSIIQEQEKRQQKKTEINQIERQTRSEELHEKEKARQREREQAIKSNKHLREKYETDFQTEKESNTQKKKEEHSFYTKAIQNHKINNTKAQIEAKEKQLDKIYMENYTNLLDEQEQQRIFSNQQRQKEIQQFVKKQAENHPKLREKKLKQEEREQMKQKVQELAETEEQQKQHVNYQKRKLQEQMRNFLTQQIEEKKEIQQKNYIDYDKIQLEACDQYNKYQTEYESKIQQLRKQQESENFQFLNEQIKQNQTKNTKYFYPLAFNQILSIPEDNLSAIESSQ